MIYWIGGVLIYFPTLHLKFFSDFWKHLAAYKEYGLTGVSFNYGNLGLDVFYNLFALLLYNVFGLNAEAWSIVYLTFHACNTYLVYRLTLLFSQSESANFHFIAFLGALLFLWSPFQTEAAIWGAALDYLMGTSACLWGIVLLDQSLSRQFEPLRLIGVHGLFLISILCHELFFVLPLLCVIYFWFKKIEPSNNLKWQYFLMYVVVPQLVLIVSYFGTHKLLRDAWIGHYGADVHLQLPIITMVTHLFHYLTKFLLFFRFLPQLVQKIIKTGLDHPLFFWMLIMLPFFLFTLLAKWVYTRDARRCKILIVLGSMFIIALLPVLNLEAGFVRNLQSDRYGYFASAFIYVLLSLSLYFLLRRAAFYVLLLFIVCSLFGLGYSLNNWIVAGNLSKKLIQNFRPYLDHSKIYVLNMPDNYRGVYLFRLGFSDAIYVKYDKRVGQKLNIVAWHNLQHPTDGVTVQNSTQQSWKIKLDSWGRWFWYYGRGARSYKTKDYYADFTNKVGWYKISWRHPPADNSTVLYQKGKEWKSVKVLNNKK